MKCDRRGNCVFIMNVGASGPDGFWMCQVVAVKVLNDWISFFDKLAL